MRAVILRRHGGPEVLELADVDEPVAAPDRVRVQVHACGVNHLDLHIRRGLDRVQISLPHILGSDVAGEVLEDSADGRWLRGARVVVAPGVSCGACRDCTNGRDHLCREFGVVGGYQLDGGYAEIVSVPPENLFPLPAGISYEVAASLPTAYQTAWHMIAGIAQLDAGDVVVVHGASGGVGFAAVQIASLLGARVLAVTSSPEKVTAIKEGGAEHVFASEEFRSSIEKILGRRRVRAVIDHLGAPVIADSLRLLQPGGLFITCGATAGHQGCIDLRQIFARNLSIVGSSLGPRADLATLLGLVESGRLSPAIYRRLELEQAAEAHRLLERGEVTGKVVLTISTDGRAL
jgi:NADPH:quinone reductase-like Zn-dependent oxidoreductase